MTPIHPTQVVTHITDHYRSLTNDAKGIVPILLLHILWGAPPLKGLRTTTIAWIMVANISNLKAAAE